MSLADNLIAFGNRGGLLSRIEKDRELRLNNQKREQDIATAQRDEQKASRLSELYAQTIYGGQGPGAMFANAGNRQPGAMPVNGQTGPGVMPVNGQGGPGGVGGMFANAGNRQAEQEIARLDPQFHMQLQTRLQAMNEQQRQQLAEEAVQFGRSLVMAKGNPQMMMQLGVRPEDYDMTVAKYSALSENLFNTVQDSERAQTGFELQRRGQDITMRGQDITRRGQDINVRETQGTGDMRKYQELVSLGVPDNIARGISYGAYRNVTDPASGATLIIDLTSNQPIGRMVPSDPSKPYTSGYRWEPDMKNGMIQRPAGGSASNMNTGTIERGLVPPGNPYADPNDPLGLFK